ncbi:hypothetical protein ACFYRG_38450 [Streptomyces mirabilis]|uniref:hypothetical protein n=1 Tax=Streptomyces mirabilis TaxID=68239 RepID=UPI0036BCE2B8
MPSADPDERVRQLEARVAELEASERKLATERDILRKAAVRLGDPPSPLPEPVADLMRAHGSPRGMLCSTSS